ncbi:hypothetical protein Tco_0044586 [Tanacetum coccineum]
MILEFVENGPLIWPSIEENGVTRPKKYSELSATEALQADCDIKATNIILQGLPPEVYALVSNHKVAKELWERIQLLMQGTSMTKQERECKLYDEFDKFAYKKGESLREFYLRFSLLLNDMNIYNMKLEQFQVNTKFLNTLPPEWSKFGTNVKLNQFNVSMFHKGDDSIDAINHMIDCLTAVGRQTSVASGVLQGLILRSKWKQFWKTKNSYLLQLQRGRPHVQTVHQTKKGKGNDTWFKDESVMVQAKQVLILHEEELVFLADLGIPEGTDISKITRKPSKTGKHGHGERKSTKEAKDAKPKPGKGETSLKHSHWPLPTRRTHVDSEENTRGSGICSKLSAKEAQGVTITDCQAGNPCELRYDPTP